MGGALSCRPEENPTMRAIEEQHRREEAERKAQAERLRRDQEATQRAAQLAEQLERERQAQAKSLRREQEAAQRAAQLAEQLRRERQAQAERIRVQQEEAQRAAENTRRLEREMQEQIEFSRREREAAKRAAEVANELQEQMWKEEEAQKAIEEQKVMEAKWKTDIHPVEWPSKETYEATKLRFYKEGKFHLAIVGISGTGKSSLINAFRGIWDNDEGAAMTDILESTSVVTPYPDPDPANPFIWFDVPGSGTLACSDWTYFNDQGLYIFDAIIILFNDRFTATDIAILKNCARYNIPTYIVRSKSDVRIDNIIKKKMRKAGAKANPADILGDACKEYLARTRESVRLNLMKNDPPIKSQKMYAVSRDTLTMVVREEPLEGMLVLNESELLWDILQDGCSRRFEKSYGTMSDLIKKTGMGIIRFIAS
ncbi:P-loop containing nucleoside triphosphate hydrolase protein [Armillaria solidipes]|uniref:P-loop containing nucleoside triphosphate hydrolase protein n=1 Tax=Armillaria solidipes TaxID=1076256 RepID=A0A2H3C4T5_9AGAR|nr:P-loop containing nucleoside triphosphate hydrolase protein [Armillaria solidipes]